MIGNRFLVGNDLKNIIPELVSKELVLPLLENNGLGISQIAEWSIHQGGEALLDGFLNPDVLGLSVDDIARSKKMFEMYGNFSSPSCFFVLDSFFNEDSTGKTDKFGLMLGFGAGYYIGALLYQWV